MEYFTVNNVSRYEKTFAAVQYEFRRDFGGHKSYFNLEMCTFLMYFPSLQLISKNRIYTYSKQGFIPKSVLFRMTLY